jgi:hypothetical protein
MTKFELDLHNPMMYPCIKFELNVYNCSRDNERKPIYGMMKGNTICPRPFHGGGIKIPRKTVTCICPIVINPRAHKP